MLLDCRLRVALLSAYLAVFVGCATSPSGSSGGGTSTGSGGPATWFTGRVMGGLSPVSGATVQLYTVGTTGDGSASTPLLTKSLTTDASGNFSVPTLSNGCTGTSILYLVATGGAAVAGKTNSAITMMTVLGACDLVASGSIVVINELTTVAAVSAAQPYMTSAFAIGAGSGDGGTMASALGLAGQYVSVSTGVSPGLNVAPGEAVPADLINTLGDLIVPCVESGGGVAGDGSACGNLFSLAMSGSGAAPVDTATALLNIASNPTNNAGPLFALVGTAGLFQPQLATAPPSWDVRLHLSALLVSPSSVAFGNVNMGSMSTVQSVTLTNTAILTATVTLAIGGAEAGDFAESGPCASIAAGASCVLSVTATPTAVGTRSATLVINSNVGLFAQNVGLLATGVGVPALTLSTSSLSFGNVNVGSTSTSQSVTLTNGGNAAATVSFALSGAQAGDFAFSNSCGSSIAVGASCTVSVTAKPTATGTRSASLVITSNAAGSPASVALTATGVGTPAVSLSNTSLNFGNQTVSTQSALTTVTLTNSGTASLLITNISVIGAASGVFPEASNCGTVAVGGTCTISLEFSPGTTGLQSGTLEIFSNAANSPDTVALSGTGVALLAPAVTLSQSSLNFGNQNVGISSTPMSVTLQNTGTASLTVSSVTVNGAIGANFTQTNTCGTVVVGGMCSINVVFTPSALGAQSASVSIVSNAASSPNSVALSGTGVSAGGSGVVTVSTTSLNFDIDGALEDVVVTNPGNTPVALSVSETDITSANQPLFAVSQNTCAPSLPAMSTCVISVASLFGTVNNNGVPETFTGTLTINDGVPSDTHTIALSAQDTTYWHYQTGLTSFGGALTFPANQVGYTQTAPLLGYQALSYYTSAVPPNVAITGTDASDFAYTDSPSNGNPSSPCLQVLVQGQACLFAFTFTPSAPGARTAKFVLNATEGEYLLLTGTGVGAGPSFAGVLSMSVLNEALPSTPDPNSTTSSSSILTITNTGTTAFSFSGSFSGPNTSLMSVDGSACASVAPQATCVAYVRFNATSPGNYSATLNVKDANSTATQAYPLTMTAVWWQPAGLPDQPSFGNEAIGTQSAAKTITIGDPNGYPLGHALSVQLPPSSNFVLTQGSSCPASTTQLCTISVAFSPHTLGNIQENMTITDEVTGLTSLVQLIGNGGSPVVSLSSASVAFGSRTVGTTSIPTVVTLTNTGTLPLTVSSVSVAGAVSGNFTETNNCASIAVNGTCTINIVFAPKSPGSQSATVNIVSNAASSPDSIALSGTA